MPTSRYCDQAPASISAPFSRIAAGEPGLHPAKSSPSARRSLRGTRRAFPAAPGSLLDDALQQRLREGHAGRLDRLQVDRREKARAAGQALVARSVGEDILKRADARPLRRAQRLGRRRRLAKVAHGREIGADVEDAVVPNRSDRGAVDVGPPDARRRAPAKRSSGSVDFSLKSSVAMCSPVQSLLD